jgi:hypothetical protein
MKTRKVGLAMLVAVLAMTLAATPASAVSKPEKKQNKALKTLNKRTKATNKRLKRFSTNLGKLAADVKNAKDGLTAIQVAVPTVISSLTQLKTGLETAGAGLKTLGGAFTGYVRSAEYGVVQLYLGTTPIGGQILNSSDVPDDGNGATLTGRLLAPIGPNTPAVPVILRAALRSDEKDGTGAANPAGAAGLVAMTVSGHNATVAGGNPLDSTLPLTSRANGTGDPGPDGPPVFQINDKAPRADTPANPFAFPSAKSIELTDPATLQPLTGAPGRFTASNATANPGAIEVSFTVRFHDLQASATDLEQ